MPIYTNVPATTRLPGKKDNALPACPVCGGLECLCRPRFFAGQLLTDEDLNRLDHYIRAKNRLHNRYLHGAGVVCGLEVFCHPCEGYVTVTAGYAISPCGEDIVVCQDDAVNVCELIQRCRDRDRQAYDCDPFRPYGSDDDCQDLEEEWLLTICYGERATRGTMALRGAGACGPTRCSCGGAGGCGCQERTNGHAANGARKAAKATPAQCEPTVTCETYRFELRRAPAQRTTDRSQAARSAIVQRVLCCLAELPNLPPLPAEQTRENMQRWCCDLKRAFQEALVQLEAHNCQLDDRLAAFHCPDPRAFDSDEAYRQAVIAAVQSLTTIVAELLRTCICSALLPPCPKPVDDDCLVLASIRVRRRDCRIISVCNVDFREIAISAPALKYWLSILPIGDSIRQGLARLCCQPFRTEGIPVAGFQRASAFERSAEPGFAAGERVAAASFATRGREFSNLVAQAWAGRSRTVSAYTLLLDALGAVDAQGQSLISPLERLNPLEAVLLNQLALPLVGDFLPEPKRSEPQPAPDDIRAEIARLRATVEQQQETIEALQRASQRTRRRGGG